MISSKNVRKIFDSPDADKSMKNKNGKKIESAGKNFAKIADKKVLTKSAELVI